MNLCVVLSDTRRIINANCGHFLAISLLFILPLSISAIVYPSLSKPTAFISIRSRLFSFSFTTLPKDEIPPVDKSAVIFTVISSPFELLFSILPTASISRSILNGFSGEPLKLTSSLKSILVSFFPLTMTHIVSRMILGFIVFAVARLAESFGNVCFPGFIIMIMVLLIGVMIYFQLEWYLADVMVVVESKWGFAPLIRSSYLVKGARSIAFSISVFHGLSLGIMSANSFPSSVRTPINSGSCNWMLVLRSASFIVIATICRLYSVAATAVLFIHCKRSRDALASQSGDEFRSHGDEKDHNVSLWLHRAFQRFAASACDDSCLVLVPLLLYYIQYGK